MPAPLSTQIRPPISRTRRVRDGQAQARAAELAGGRVVRLCERLEDLLLFLDGNADAGVAGRGSASGSSSAVSDSALHADQHFARLGELHRVADQVDDDLPQAAGIAQQVVRHICRAYRQFSSRPFLCAAMARIRSASPSAGRNSKSKCSRSSLPASILEKSRMSLITVEQRFGRALDDREILALLGE